MLGGPDVPRYPKEGDCRRKREHQRMMQTSLCLATVSASRLRLSVEDVAGLAGNLAAPIAVVMQPVRFFLQMIPELVGEMSLFTSSV